MLELCKLLIAFGYCKGVALKSVSLFADGWDL